MTRLKRRWWTEILNRARRANRRRSAREKFARALGAMERLENRWVLSGASLITINDPSITEGDSGSANLTFMVSRTGETSTNVTVGFNTSDLSPIANLVEKISNGRTFGPNGPFADTFPGLQPGLGKLPGLWP